MYFSIHRFKIVLFVFCSVIDFTQSLAFAQTNRDTSVSSQPISVSKLVRLMNADAKNAMEVEDSIVGPVNVSLGFGERKEIKADPPHYQYEENNSAWYKFTVDQDTVLTFDIVPLDSLDDYDFALFKCADSVCTGRNNGNQLKMVRICYSMCTSKSGMTGLSHYSDRVSIPAGPGLAYVSGVDVKAGETYYLMVNYSEGYMHQKRDKPLGFRLYFYNYNPKKKPIVLNNIFFESGKSILKKESFPELDKLAKMLSKSQMVIEVRGHTDNEGNEKSNRVLSEERAKAVADYLISKNINKSRLFYKGFGSSKPLAPNTTDEGRKKNRRVEFVKVMY